MYIKSSLSIPANKALRGFVILYTCESSKHHSLEYVGIEQSCMTDTYNNLIIPR